MTKQQRPQPGDAIRLISPRWYTEVKGAIGIIGGMVGKPLEGSSITFRYSAFLDDVVCSCSGGPASIWTSVDELIPTNETLDVLFWKWKDGISGAGRGENYTKTVQVWEWNPWPEGRMP